MTRGTRHSAVGQDTIVEQVVLAEWTTTVRPSAPSKRQEDQPDD